MDDAKDDQSVCEVDVDDAKYDQNVFEVVYVSDVNDNDFDDSADKYDVDTIYWVFNGDTDLDITDLKMSPWNTDHWSNSTTSFVFPQVPQSV